MRRTHAWHPCKNIHVVGTHNVVCVKVEYSMISLFLTRKFESKDAGISMPSKDTEYNFLILRIVIPLQFPKILS